MVLLGERWNPNYYLGNRMRIFMKAGAVLNVVVTERIFNFISVVCDDGEKEEIMIDIEDIDFIVDFGQ